MGQLQLEYPTDPTGHMKIILPLRVRPVCVPFRDKSILPTHWVHLGQTFGTHNISVKREGNGGIWSSRDGNR